MTRSSLNKKSCNSNSNPFCLDKHCVKCQILSGAGCVECAQNNAYPQRNDISVWSTSFRPLAVWDVARGTSCVLTCWFRMGMPVQPTDSLCYITNFHSRGGDGHHGMPIFTLCVKNDTLNACWSPGNSTAPKTFGHVPLSSVVGKWVRITISAVFNDGRKGSLHVRMMDLQNKPLLNTRIIGIATWRGGDVVRYRVGLYSQHRQGLRSRVSFDLSKKSDC